MRHADFLVVGAGIAGASAAYYLARRGSVVMLERESQPGFHSTGRSAAVYAASYGPRPIRILSKAAGAFLRAPPPGFSDVPLMHPRGGMFVARPDQRDLLEAVVGEVNALDPVLEMLDGAAARALCPVLRPERVAAAALDRTVMDMDVNAIHRGYLAGAKARGAVLATGAEVTALERRGGAWRARTAAGDFAAPVVVNAAGAWADALAALAGARPIGLVPKRRTVIVFAAPMGLDIARWPVAADLGEEWYFKPESGRILASPADETPVPPHDVQPEELDVAVTADRVEAASTLKVERILSRWAGLRSFVADKAPVVGFAAEAPGFFWLAGQGGYGIQSSDAMGRVAASLASGEGLPPDIAALGLAEAELAPARLWNPAPAARAARP
jgi:D-arginine dehydrogenase